MTAWQPGDPIYHRRVSSARIQRQLVQLLPCDEIGAPYEWRPATGHKFDPWEPCPWSWLGVDSPRPAPIEVAA